MTFARFTVLVVSLLALSGCGTKPEVGDRFTVITRTPANRDLTAYDQAMYRGGGRGDFAAINSMLNSGAIFMLEPGVTGEILGFPRPVVMDSGRSNLNDSMHSVADVRLDNPSRYAVMNIDEKVRLTKQEKPATK